MVSIANLCMITHPESNDILVIERTGSWPGLAFPGGKLENGESIHQSVIREVKEETGLTIYNPEFCGLKHWYNDTNHERFLVFCFKADSFTGKLRHGKEGKVSWIPKAKLNEHNIAKGLYDEMMIFDKSQYFEGFSVWNENYTKEFDWQ